MGYYSQKRVVFTQKESIYIETSEIELSLANPSEIIVENLFSHISAGTELACLAGLEDWFNFPATPGYTSIGKVIRAGEATNFQTGELVYTFGPHAKYFKIDITDRWHGICVKIPENTDLKQAAFTHMASIAITALRKSNIELGDIIAIAGLGAIGNLAAQLAQLQGAHVIGIDFNQKRLQIALECGLQHVFTSQKTTLDNLLHEASFGKGVSTFIDATGSPQVIEKAIRCISRYGELILLGSPRAAHQINLTDFLQHIHLWSHGSVTVKGALEFTYPTHSSEFNKHSILRNSEIILQLIRDQKINIAPLISHVISVDDAASAYLGLKNKPDEYIGVIFDWGI